MRPEFVRFCGPNGEGRCRCPGQVMRVAEGSQGCAWCLCEGFLDEGKDGEGMPCAYVSRRVENALIVLEVLVYRGHQLK